MTSARGFLAGVLLLCLIAFGVAGCGGSDDSETSSEEPQTLSKAQYVKQADAICEEANDRQEALLQKAAKDVKGSPSKSDQANFVVNAGVPPLREAAASLEELGAPAGEEEKAEAFVDALEEALDEVEAEPVEFAEGQSAPFAPAERQAKKLGLEVCGRP